NTPLEQSLSYTQPVHDLEGAFRPADGAAALREAPLAIDDGARLAAGGKAERGSQPCGPCADDDHGAGWWLRPPLVGRAAVRERELAGISHGENANDKAALSTSAVRWTIPRPVLGWPWAVGGAGAPEVPPARSKERGQRSI